MGINKITKRYVGCPACLKPAVLIKDDAEIGFRTEISNTLFLHLDGAEVKAGEMTVCENCGVNLMGVKVIVNNSEKIINAFSTEYIKEFKE